MGMHFTMATLLVATLLPADCFGQTHTTITHPRRRHRETAPEASESSRVLNAPAPHQSTHQTISNKQPCTTCWDTLAIVTRTATATVPGQSWRDPRELKIQYATHSHQTTLCTRHDCLCINYHSRRPNKLRVRRVKAIL